MFAKLKAWAKRTARDIAAFGVRGARSARAVVREGGGRLPSSPIH